MKILLALLCVVAFSPSAMGRDEVSPQRFPWRGVFEPRAEAVIPSEMAGTVVAMPKKPGERCAAGDVIVEFDSSLANAAVVAMQARVDAEKENSQGIQNLYDRNQATGMELSRAKSELARAEFELATGRHEARVCVVRAPFEGRIVEVKVREHEWAGKGAPLLLLVDDSLLRVRFFLPEDSFSRIAVGDPVRVWVPAASREVEGTVARLGVVFDPVSRTFDVWADVDNADDVLRAGMTAEVAWPATEAAGE